jgi:hypothetical protein
MLIADLLLNALRATPIATDADTAGRLRRARTALGVRAVSHRRGGTRPHREPIGSGRTAPTQLTCVKDETHHRQSVESALTGSCGAGILAV